MGAARLHRAGIRLRSGHIARAGFHFGCGHRALAVFHAGAFGACSGSFLEFTCFRGFRAITCVSGGRGEEQPEHKNINRLADHDRI